MGARGAVSPIITDFEQRICVVLILEEVAMRKKKPIRSDMGWSTSERIVVCGLDLPKEILGKVSLGDMAWLEIKGSLPSPQQSAVFNAMLVTLVEHGMTPMAIASRLTYLGAPESLQAAIAAGLCGMGTTYAGTAEGAARLDIRGTSPSIRARPGCLPLPSRTDSREIMSSSSSWFPGWRRAQQESRCR